MVSASAQSSPLHVRFGEFELDEANALLLRGASAIALSPTPFGLLCALARHPGALLTKHVEHAMGAHDLALEAVDLELALRQAGVRRDELTGEWRELLEEYGEV